MVGATAPVMRVPDAPISGVFQQAQIRAKAFSFVLSKKT